MTETSYLTADNYLRYRAILRFFYNEYEKIRYWLYKEDVFCELKKYDEFSDYTMDLCKSDLEQLIAWKNIIPLQDSSKVSTIEEYKNKQFRYYLSEFSVEIERLTIKLENLIVEGASLSPSLFERIRRAIFKIDDMEKISLSDVHLWWEDLQSDFKRLNQNYQDYIRTFYSPNSERFMRSMDFIVYKDNLVKYLREFVKELQRNAPEIEIFLKKLSEDVIKSVLDLVISSEKSIVRFDKKIEEENMEENIRGKWNSLVKWFVGSSENDISESSRILGITNNIISKIVKNAAMISQMRNVGVSKLNDYEKFLSLFKKCETLEEAKKLSSVVFGAETMMHYKVNRERVSDSLTSSVYDEPPNIYEIEERKRGFRSKSEQTGFEDKFNKKQEALKKYLEEVELERELMRKYKKDGKIELFNMPEVISSKIRDKLLFWITIAGNNSNLSGRTEDGILYYLKCDDKLKICNLECEDGILNMPPYVLIFDEEYV